MNKTTFFFAFVFIGVLAAAPDGSGKDPALLLVPGPVIEVPGSHGKFDFLEIDEVGHRLLGSHTRDGTLDIFDLSTNRLLARPATGAAQDSACDVRGGRYFASVSDEKQVAIIDAKTHAVWSTYTDGKNAYAKSWILP